MFNFSFYRFAFHTIKPPKTCPVRKKQCNILVPLHRKSNNIIRNRPEQILHWIAKLGSIGLQNWEAPLDCKTGLHWLAKSTPFSCAKISAPFYMCSDCELPM